MEFTLSEHIAYDVCSMHTLNILEHIAQDQFSVLSVFVILAFFRCGKVLLEKGHQREISAFYI